MSKYTETESYREEGRLTAESMMPKSICSYTGRARVAWMAGYNEIVERERQ